MQLIHAKPAKPAGIPYRIQPGTFACFERHLLAQCMGDHQNIRKQDRGIEAEPPQRLQGYLGCFFRVVAQVQKTACNLPDRTVFRQITASLAHKPDGRWADAFAVKRSDQRFYGFV